MQAILNKIVSSVTYDVTGNPSIQMSFWQGSSTAPNKGAFSDIPLPVFTSIIDNILPENKKYIYVKNDKQIKPYHGLKYTSGKTSETRFEIWKADEKGELFFDLKNVNQIEQQDALARILKKQGIYFSDGQYSFPLYKVNNYESGQIFILTELDGKPITSSFFANLFNSYKSKSESTELLKGSTAKYVVYKRQGLDRISPNGLTSETASSLYEAAKGEKSISAKRVEAKELPKGLTYVPNNETIIVKDLDLANELKDARYKVKDEEWYIRSGSLTYKITMDRRGQVYVYKRGKSSFFSIYNQTKEMSEEKELTQFLEKIGFADMASFLQSDSNVKSSIVPAPGTTNVFSVLSYNVNKKKSEGVAPNVTEPVTEELNKDNPFKDLPLKNTIEQLNEAVLDLNDINQNLVVHEPGDELTVYFNKSDNEQDLELKSFNKTQYGFRVVLSPGGAKEYTYFVDNKGVGEKIEILTEGIFEITPELIAEKNVLEEKAKQLFEVYQSKASQQVFIQGRFPTFAISPVLENITIQRERRRQISENPDNFETYRGEPEEITGYKIIIPGHDTQLYLTSQNMIEDLRTGRSMPALTASRSIKNFIEGVTKAATNLIKGSEKESVLAEIGFDVTKFYKPEKDLSDVSEFPEVVSATETTIEYTPVGKQRQTYTIRGNKVFNKAGQEVFKEDSVDRNKIFANLALKQGRAVLVEHKGAKYIVNNKNQIISGTTGKMMQWDENNGDRKAIVALAQEKFPTKPTSQKEMTIEQVKELFESNPQLASDVYDAIGIQKYRKTKPFDNYYEYVPYRENRLAQYDIDRLAIIAELLDETNDQDLYTLVKGKKAESDKYDSESSFFSEREFFSYLADLRVKSIREKMEEYKQGNRFKGKDVLLKIGRTALGDIVDTILKSRKGDITEATSEQKKNAQETYLQYLQTTSNPSIKGFKEFISPTDDDVTDDNIFNC
jgi:hypothetical protein